MPPLRCMPAARPAHRMPGEFTMTCHCLSPRRPALPAYGSGVRQSRYRACAAWRAVAVAWLCASALISGAGANEPATNADAGAALRAEIDGRIGPARCKADTDCSTLALGARACGGPDSHVAWSVRGTDTAALQRAADRYTLWHAQTQRRSANQSICMIEVDPGALCSRQPSGTVAGPPSTPAPAAATTTVPTRPDMGRCVLVSHPGNPGPGAGSR